MDTSLDVILIANAGLLLRCKEVTLLLDGIFDGAGHSFASPGKEILEHMRLGKHPFERIDYLLFSHIHPDHCSPELVLRFLKSRHVKGVFLPAAPFDTECGLKLNQYLLDNNIAHVYGTKSVQTYQLAPDILVQVLPTRHLDQKYRHVPHFCFLISFGRSNYLFTADVDYTIECFSTIQGMPLNAVFMNPLFFSALCHNRFFNGELQTQNICIYHIPPAEQDLFDMRWYLRRDLDTWPGEASKVILLHDTYQHIKIL